MTNREWLNSLSDEDLMRWFIYDDKVDGTLPYCKIAFQFNSSYLGMIKWLKVEHGK